MKTVSGFGLKVLPIDSLEVSARAQRESSQDKIERMVNLFQPRGFGIPLVNHRVDGRYFVLDGQHRVKAAQLKGYTEILCEVAEGLSEEQEADLFILRNNNLEVYAVHKFNIGVTAGYERESAINDVLEKLGMKVAFKANREWIKVTCVITLYRIYEQYGSEILSLALETANAAFGQHGLKATIIEALANVYANLDVDFDFVVAKLQIRSLSTADPQRELEIDAAKIKMKIPTWKSPICMTAAIVDKLNSKKRGGKFQYWW